VKAKPPVDAAAYLAERNGEIGMRIATARICRGLTQAAAAGLLGVSTAQVAAMEAGRRGPGKATIGRLREVFGLVIEPTCPHCGRTWGPHEKRG
jgi:transcriptional regulator with XRE-family HTH domain